MATSAERLLDTSVAIPFLVRGHSAHAATQAALPERELGLAGHAGFETYSVLTRMPEPARTSPAAAIRLIRHNFPASRHLSAGRAKALLASLAEQRVSGAAVYDALVAAAALEHGCVLVTRDRRAVSTYSSVGVEFLVLE